MNYSKELSHEPRFDHPLLRAWCPDHGYFWSSCPGCVWRDHGDKFGMTLAAVEQQKIAKVLEDQLAEAQ